MIRVKLNDLKYQYDVYQIVNQFFDFEEIKFVNEDYDYLIEIDCNVIKCLDSRGIHVYMEEIKPVLSLKEQVKIVVFKYFSSLMDVEMPWGTLVGIRPTKKVIALMDNGANNEEIIKYFHDHYLVSKYKTGICIEVAHWERKLVNKDKNKISVYIGMPFCPTRCLYCSFTSNSIKNNSSIVDEYIKALIKEIVMLSDYVKSKELKVQCIYFGGGTPTSVNDGQFELILKTIYDNFYSKDVEEFTVECGRPDSITENKLTSMKKYSVGRISINPQTMNDDTLKSIGRNHSSEDVHQKFNLARSLNFDNINMDIIVGLPGEGKSQVEITAERIKSLNPDNVTVHGLCVKRGSKLHERMLKDYKLNKLGQKQINEMYQITNSFTKELNMHPYYMYRQKNMIGNMENIGYSKDCKEGIYNIQMIQEKQTILALGADAVSKVVFIDEGRHERYANVKDVHEYINRIDEMIAKKIQLFDTLYN